MPLFRQIDQTYLKVRGQTLTFDADQFAADFGLNTVDVTYPLSGSYDFRTDGNYTDSMIDPHYDGADVSGVLGDGVNTPLFYAYGRSNIAGLTLNGGLEFEFAGGMVVADGWPSTDRGPAVIIPLPNLASWQIDLTMTTNMMEKPLGAGGGQGQYHHCDFGVYRIVDTGGTPTETAVVYWDGVNSSSITEKASVSGTGSATATLTGTTSITKKYRFVRNQNGAAIYGESSPGSGTFTLLYGRGYPKRYLGTHSEAIYWFQGTGNGLGAGGMKAALSSLSIRGTRAVF